MFYEGRQIGGYTLLCKLGKGGFGEVWLAEKRSQFVTKKVAVKLPLDEQVNFDAIRQEAELWEQASGHPNVLPIIDADVFDGQVVIVSEYADGGSLADRLKREGKLALQKAVEITIGILNGLEFLHSRKIIHRDIKPQNILLQGDTPRLADFGISRAMNTTIVSSTIIGTDAYMSPESFDGKRNVQTDIWSVGVVLYALLADRLPFPQEHPSERMFAILTKEFEPLTTEVPQNLQRIVAKSLAKQPENRYQTTSEMRDELQKALLGIAHPTFAPTEVFRIPVENLPTIPALENKYETNEPEKETVVSPQNINIPALTEASFPQESVVTNFRETPPMTNEPAILQTQEVNKASRQFQMNDKPLSNKPQKSYDSLADVLRKNTGFVYYLLFGVAGVFFLLGVTFIFSKVNYQPTLSNRVNTASNSSNISSNPTDLTNKRLIPYKKKNHFGYVDENKKIVIEPKDFYKAGRFIDGLAIVGSVIRAGIIDKTGKEIVPSKYYEVEPFQEGLALVRSDVSNPRYGFVDKTGKEVIPLKYDYAESFSEGLASVKFNGKYQFIDKSENVVIPPSDKYTSTYQGSFDEGLAKVASKDKDDKYGFIDKTGQIAIPLQYDYAGKFSEGLAVVKVKDKLGFIDKTGKMVISPKFYYEWNEGMPNFSEGLACLCLGNESKCGFIDKTGEFAIAPQYTRCSIFSEGLASVESGDLEGIIDKTGKQIIPFKYRYILPFKDGLALVSTKDAIDFYIDKNGTEYYEP